MRQPIPVTVTIGDQAVCSSTQFASAGAHVLVLSTTIASPRAPVSLHSTYVGHRDTDTAVTHLLLAPGPAGADLQTSTHAPGRLAVDDDDRHPCLYDHLQRLLGALQDLGHSAAIDVLDPAVEQLDH